MGQLTNQIEQIKEITFYIETPTKRIERRETVGVEHWGTISDEAKYRLSENVMADEYEVSWNDEEISETHTEVTFYFEIHSIPGSRFEVVETFKTTSWNIMSSVARHGWAVSVLSGNYDVAWE